jgi:FkbM family methyltransferase
MKDYSQNSEQAVILKYFGGFVGTALSCGENDGETFSNVRALALLGWKLVCVEPAPTAFSKLAELYQDHIAVQDSTDVATLPFGICINAAITPFDGSVDFYDSGTHLHKGDTSLLSTTRPEELARWKKSGEVFTKTTVRGITFETLMRETGVNHFDFISIDAEGADFDILKQIDLTAVGCRMLCVEVNVRGDREFTEYAARHGMRLHWSCYENRIYCK